MEIRAGNLINTQIISAICSVRHNVVSIMTESDLQPNIFVIVNIDQFTDFLFHRIFIIIWCYLQVEYFGKRMCPDDCRHP